MPVAVTVPSDAFQLTLVFETVPCMAALNESVPPVTEDAFAGDTVTEVTPEAGR